jgi:hypothetical protein
MTQTETQTYQDAVLKTVMFWSEKSFNTKMNQNNGDDSSNGAITHMLMNMLSMQSQDKLTPDKIKRFEQKLTEILISERENRLWDITLDVDYHPCQQLYEAAQFAGIDPGCFPCKTCTIIKQDNTALAKYQYGGKFITL